MGWSVFLTMEGPRLTGLVSHCATTSAAPAEIHDSSVAGNTITFKCTSSDRDRTLTFTGVINGDAITLDWEKRVRNGGLDNGAVDQIFGPLAPRQFTAKRVPDGELAKAADEVRGLEFAAAVNLLPKDTKAEGLLFVPRKLSRVRTVIVVIRYGLGFSIPDSPVWRRLAESLESALLSVRFSSIDPIPGGSALASVSWANGGSEALLSLLRRFAEESGHPELSEAPLVLWGHSGGGGVASILAGLHPGRVLAFVRYHSGPVGGDVNVVSKIPALFLAGGQDKTASPRTAETLWKTGRSLGAPWTFAVEPDATHGDAKDVEKANALMIPWITAVVRQRLSPEGATLAVVNDGSAWMGNNRTGEVAPYNTFTGSKLEASWLPDEPSARGWRVVLGAVK